MYSNNCNKLAFIPRKHEEKDRYDVDDNTTFVPEKGSKWEKYKTKWCYRLANHILKA